MDPTCFIATATTTTDNTGRVNFRAPGNIIDGVILYAPATRLTAQLTQEDP